jgi:hypothetical protein
MLSFEERFRAKYSHCRLEIESLSSCMDRFHVYVGNLHVADSGERELAFRWALQDIKSGAIKIPDSIEQIRLFPVEL